MTPSRAAWTGHEAPAAALALVAEQAAAGVGRILLVTGARGSGKSALMAAAGRGWERGPTLVIGAGAGGCVPTDLFDQALAAVRRLGVAVPGHAELIDQAVRGRSAVGAGWRANPIPLAHDVVRLLRPVAALRPTVIVVEDVHLACPASTAVLAMLLPSTRAAGAGAVLSGVPGLAPSLAALADQEVVVPALDDDRVAEVVGGWLPGGFGPDAMLLAAVRAGLGPLARNLGALRSVRDALLADDRLVAVDRHVCLREPERPIMLDRGHHLVRRALDETEPAARRLSLTVAALGQVRLGDLSEVIDQSALPRYCGYAVDELVADGVLVVDDGAALRPAAPALTERLRHEAGHRWCSAMRAAVTPNVVLDESPGISSGEHTVIRYRDACLRSYLAGDWDSALSTARAVEVAGAPAPEILRQARLLAAEICAEQGEQRRADTWLRLADTDPADCHLAAWVACGNRQRAGRAADAVRAGWAWYRAGSGRPCRGTAQLLGRIAELSLLADDHTSAEQARRELAGVHRSRPDSRQDTTLAMIAGVLDGDLVRLRSAVDRAVRGQDQIAVIRGCLLAATIDDEPERWLRAGYRIAQRVGAVHSRRRLAELSRVRGIPVPRNRGQEPGLSWVEVRVADMVSGGRTNRQIASALSVSEKTVEGHLTRLFDKTGCRSRVQLAAAHLQGRLAPAPDRLILG